MGARMAQFLSPIQLRAELGHARLGHMQAMAAANKHVPIEAPALELSIIGINKIRPPMYLVVSYMWAAMRRLGCLVG